MDGFRKAKNTPSVEQKPPAVVQQNTLESLNEDPAVMPEIDLNDTPQETPKPSKSKRAWIIVGVTIGIAALAAIAAAIWYSSNLQPVDSSNELEYDVTIEGGDSLTTVASFLEGRGLIRSKFAFQVHAYLSGQASDIKKGNCRVSKAESSQDILNTLVKGCNEYVAIMFFPGATIERPLYKPAGAVIDVDKMYIKGVLKGAGYSDEAINQALTKQYSGPLFADKPAGATLEGYIYGQTYHLPIGSGADRVLQATFDKMYRDISDEDLVNKFKAQGLNLYEGITLASIVQRELDCEAKPTLERKERCYQYQRTIAQVFLKRFRDGGTLGSDVTFIYAADMLGVAPTIDIDSPYNTRVNVGLPPGPIASPGLQALKSVGNPTDTDYYYFIAGDDGLIYFARTEAEHQANIRDHCQILCNEL